MSKEEAAKIERQGDARLIETLDALNKAQIADWARSFEESGWRDLGGEG